MTTPEPKPATPKPAPMTPIPVESSNIASYSYDPDTKAFQVTFKGSAGKDGDTYEYSGVPAVTVMGFRDAPSKGTFLAKNIKGRYAFKKL